MGRVKIELPEHFVFQTTLTVRVTDLNYGAHLGNDALLGMIHEARMAFLESFGFSELNLAGVALIMADSAIEYKNQAYFKDPLVFKITAGDFSNKGFDIFYRITHKLNNKLIAKAKTGMVCYDYETATIQNVPENFKDNFHS